MIRNYDIIWSNINICCTIERLLSRWKFEWNWYFKFILANNLSCCIWTINSTEISSCIFNNLSTSSLTRTKINFWTEIDSASKLESITINRFYIVCCLIGKTINSNSASIYAICKNFVIWELVLGNIERVLGWVYDNCVKTNWRCTINTSDTIWRRSSTWFNSKAIIINSFNINLSTIS